MWDSVSRWLFDPSGLTPHGFCLLWEPGLIWTDALSDGGIALAYMMIAGCLMAFARRRADLAFRPLCWLFAAFILLCGTAHLLDVVTLWLPAYGLEASVKAANAIVSSATALVLWRMIPRALALPSPAQLRQANAALRDNQALLAQQAQAEAVLREQHEALRARMQVAELRRAKDELEGRVADVTRLSRAALEASEARFRQVVEGGPNAMVMTDSAGRIEMVNTQTERMFGYARAEMLGQPVEMLLPARLRERHPGLRGLFALDPRQRPMGAGRDLHGLCKDGREFLMEIGLNPIETDSGPMVLAAIINIEGRVHLEAQLRQAQKMEAIGRLTAGVAHDFNNLLQTLMGSLELLQDEFADGSSAGHDLVTMAIAAAGRGARLTHHLLAFSRKQVLRPSSVNVIGLLRQTVAMIERTIGPAIAIRIEQDDADLHVFADPGQLEASIVNLAINARDAMPKGGTLVFRARAMRIDAALASDTLPEGAYVVLAVEDNGSGIPAEIIDQVFEPFFTTKAIGEGSGLGLSMVMGYLRQSGGDVRIGGGAERGTCVELFLPRAEAAGHVVAAGPGRPILPRAGRILLVDDAPDVLVTLAAFLASAGFEVIRAHDGDEALRIVASDPRLNAMITDYAMPGMSGAEVLLQVAALRPRLPCLLVTGYPGIEGLGDLPDHIQVLRKPFLRAELLAHVTAMLDHGEGVVGTG
jgi:PAS domain S-box-containing protein